MSNPVVEITALNFGHAIKCLKEAQLAASQGKGTRANQFISAAMTSLCGNQDHWRSDWQAEVNA